MSDQPTPPSQWDHAETVHRLAMDLMNNEQTHRRLTYFLLRNVSTELLEQALEHDAQTQVKIDEYMSERVTRLAELEAERARFSDPNRPGE